MVITQHSPPKIPVGCRPHPRGLAEHAHLSVRAISDLERGVNTAPRPYTIRRLADALDLSAADRALFQQTASGTSETPSPPSSSLPRGRFLGSLPEWDLVARANEMRRIDSDQHVRPNCLPPATRTDASALLCLALVNFGQLCSPDTQRESDGASASHFGAHLSREIQASAASAMRPCRVET